MPETTTNGLVLKNWSRLMCKSCNSNVVSQCYAHIQCSLNPSVLRTSQELIPGMTFSWKNARSFFRSIAIFTRVAPFRSQKNSLQVKEQHLACSEHSQALYQQVEVGWTILLRFHCLSVFCFPLIWAHGAWEKVKVHAQKQFSMFWQQVLSMPTEWECWNVMTGCVSVTLMQGRVEKSYTF